jgi:predicted RNA polymerase sigma factor
MSIRGWARSRGGCRCRNGELNRAVAVGMADGPEAGLSIVDGLVEDRALAAYPQLPAVRGDLLARLGRREEAAGAFRRAAELTRNARERALFEYRAAELGSPVI